MKPMLIKTNQKTQFTKSIGYLRFLVVNSVSYM